MTTNELQVVLIMVACKKLKNKKQKKTQQEATYTEIFHIKFSFFF